MKAAFFPLLAGLAVLCAPDVWAEEVACAAIVPCDQQGNLLKGYGEGSDYCSMLYRSQCEQIRNGKTEEALSACSMKQQTLEARIVELERRNHRLKRRVLARGR